MLEQGERTTFSLLFCLARLRLFLKPFYGAHTGAFGSYFDFCVCQRIHPIFKTFERYRAI
jgi:hypothetical protein